jgi:signal transduction histidine kinase
MLRSFFQSNYLKEVETLLKNSVFSAQQVMALINDLLDLAKMEKGEFVFNNEFFNMREIILKGIQ